MAVSRDFWPLESSPENSAKRPKNRRKSYMAIFGKNSIFLSKIKVLVNPILTTVSFLTKILTFNKSWNFDQNRVNL